MKISQVYKQSTGATYVRVGLDVAESDVLGLHTKGASRAFKVARVGNIVTMERVAPRAPGTSEKGTGVHTFSTNLVTDNPGHHSGYSIYVLAKELGLAEGVSHTTRECLGRIGPNGLSLTLPEYMIAAQPPAGFDAKKSVASANRAAQIRAAKAAALAKGRAALAKGRAAAKAAGAKAAGAKAAGAKTLNGARPKASHKSSRIREAVNLGKLDALMRNINGIVAGHEDAVKLSVNDRGLVEAEIIHRRVLGGVVPRR